METEIVEIIISLRNVIFSKEFERLVPADLLADYTKIRENIASWYVDYPELSKLTESNMSDKSDLEILELFYVSAKNLLKYFENITKHNLDHPESRITTSERVYKVSSFYMTHMNFINSIYGILRKSSSSLTKDDFGMILC